MNRFGTRALAVLMCVGLCAPAARTAAAEETVWPRRLVMSIPMAGNVVALIQQSLARTIEKHTPIQRVIVQPIGGPASWLPKMEAGQVDMAGNNGPDTVEIVLGKGTGEQVGAKPWLRTLIPGNRNMFGLITIPGKGIETWTDLKGKVAFVRQPGNPIFERMGQCLLEAAGLSLTDLKGDPTLINFREAAADIVEGRVDAALSTASGPFMMELAQAAGENLVIAPTEEEARRVIELLPPGYYLEDLPAGSPHFNNTHEVKDAIMYRNGIFVSADMDADVAYAIIKAVDENRSEWESVSSIAPDWGTPYDYAPPYHEGVVRYYKEKGWWTGPMVEHHEELLRAVGAEK